MSEPLEIPVAYCKHCEDTGPVVVDTISTEEWVVQGLLPNLGEVTIIYCPGCKNILNFGGDLEVTWYSKEDLPKITGWRVNDGS